MTLSKTFRAAGALLVAASLAAVPASAQDLMIGSPAPALSVEEWLKGDAVKSFAPGQIYVVEFWATWCPPCLKSIPHLTELQKKYRESKVTVLGIAGFERGRTKDADLRTPLVKFVEDKGDAMAYAVAFDSDFSMSKDWMDAAGQGGIPTAFVVDGTGTIAWIGGPMDMDEPLAQIVAGTWDVKAKAAQAKAKAELDAKLQPIIEKATAAAEKQDWDGALAAIEEGLALGDDALKQLAWFKYNVHIEKKDFDGAYGFIEKGLKGALKDEDGLLDAIARIMVDEQQAARFEKKNYDLAIACSQRACEIQKGKSPEWAYLQTQASVWSAKGDAAKAVEVQTKVVELLKGKPEAEEATRQLDEYKKKLPR